MDTFYNKGDALYFLKRYEEAISCYDQCLRIDDRYVDAYHNKGFVCRVLCCSEEAIRCYDKCVELDRDFVVTCNSNHTSLSEVELILGQDDFVGLVGWFMRSMEIPGTVSLLYPPCETCFHSSFLPLFRYQRRLPSSTPSLSSRRESTL